MGLIVGVVGGRDFTDKGFLYAVLDALRDIEGIDMIVSGGAKGADELAYRYAIDDGFPRAYFRRNVRIAEHCEVLMAFPTKNSKGTWHTIKTAEKLGKKVKVWD